MKATRPKIMARLLVPFLVLAGGGASAQIFPVYDHLKCYQITDLRTPGLYVADLIPEQMPPFAAELGCKIKKKAKFFCIDVQKNPVGTPTPPLQVVGQKAQDYLCYALSCPKPTPVPTPLSLQVADQFGQGTILVKKPKYLCAPAYKIPSPTPTPQPPTPVPTPTHCPKQCVGGANAGAPCNTASECPGGSCSIPPCCCMPPGMPPCVTTADCPLAGSICICP